MEYYIARIRGFHGHIVINQTYIYGILRNGDMDRESIVRGKITENGAYLIAFSKESTVLYDPQIYLYLFKTLENGAEGSYSQFDLLNGFFQNGRVKGKEKITLIRTIPDRTFERDYLEKFTAIPTGENCPEPTFKINYREMMSRDYQFYLKIFLV